VKRPRTDSARSYCATRHLTDKDGIDIRARGIGYPYLRKAFDYGGASAVAARPIHQRHQCRARIIERMRLPRPGRVDRLARACALADALTSWAGLGAGFAGEGVTDAYRAVAANSEILTERVSACASATQALQCQPLPATGTTTSDMHHKGLAVSIGCLKFNPIGNMPSADPSVCSPAVALAVTV